MVRATFQLQLAFNVCYVVSLCSVKSCPVTQKKPGPIRYSTTTSHNSTFINDYWHRGSLFNYLLIAGDKLDTGQEPSAQLPQKQ